MEKKLKKSNYRSWPGVAPSTISSNTQKVDVLDIQTTIVTQTGIEEKGMTDTICQ